MRFFYRAHFFITYLLQKTTKKILRTSHLHQLCKYKIILIIATQGKSSFFVPQKSLYFPCFLFPDILHNWHYNTSSSVYILIGFSLVSYNVNYVKYSHSPFCQRFLLTRINTNAFQLFHFKSLRNSSASANSFRNLLKRSTF